MVLCLQMIFDEPLCGFLPNSFCTRNIGLNIWIYWRTGWQTIQPLSVWDIKGIQRAFTALIALFTDVSLFLISAGGSSWCFLLPWDYASISAMDNVASTYWVSSWGVRTHGWYASGLLASPDSPPPSPPDPPRQMNVSSVVLFTAHLFPGVIDRATLKAPFSNSLVPPGVGLCARNTAKNVR